MPSSLTRVLSSALGFSPHPPVSVCGTVTLATRLEVFLGSMGSASLRPEGLLITSRGLNGAPDLPEAPPYRLELRIPTRRWPTLLRHPIALASPGWYRNINLFPITYAFRPRLRGRLTLSGLTFLRNPWVFGEGISHPFYRYSCRHTHFHFVHRSSRSGFDLLWNAPLPSLRTNSEESAGSVLGLSPVTFSAQNHSTSELLRFL